MVETPNLDNSEDLQIEPKLLEIDELGLNLNLFILKVMGLLSVTMPFYITKKCIIQLYL